MSALSSSRLSLAVAFGLGAAVAASTLLVLWRGRHTDREANASLPPTLFRRSTLLVRSMEASLRLYRDILGLEVVFDKTLPIGGHGLPTGVFDAQARLVFLRSHVDHQVGVIALMQYLDKPVPAPDAPRRKLKLGDQVLVMNTTGVAQRMRLLKQLKGVYIQSEGTLDSYPTANGGTVTVNGNSFFDADGHFLELNEVTIGKIA